MHRGAVVLDYGCGSGDLANELVRDFSVICVDDSEVAVEVSRKNLRTHPNITVHQISENKLPLQGATLDAVVCNLVLMMMAKRTEITDAFSEFSRCLNNDGIAIVSVTHPDFRKYVFPSFFNTFPDDYDDQVSGAPYTVNITQPNGDVITLIDHNWSFRDYLSIAYESGLWLCDIKQPVKIVNPEDESDFEWNRKVDVPPFAVLIFRKRATRDSARLFEKMLLDVVDGKPL